MGNIEPALAERLGRERNIWFCTLRANGSPHITPVWFVYTDETFWISSGARNVKVRNVIRDPRVSIALEDGTVPAVAEGRAVVHTGSLRPDILAAIAAKYDGWDAAAEIEPFGARVLVEVPVTRWLMDGSA